MPIPNPPTEPVNIALQDVVPQRSFALSQVAANQANLTKGNKFLNDGTTVLHIYNGATGTAAATVTIWAVPDEAARTGTSAASIALPNASIGYQTTIAQGKTKIFGPYRQAWFNQTSADVGYVYVAVSLPAMHTTGVLISPINY